jgi:hypothetical protein
MINFFNFINQPLRNKEMAKNNALKKHKVEEDVFDFSEMMEEGSYNDELMAGVMNGLIEASNNQMLLAIELTKLAVEKNPAKEMNEDDVFSIFKKASGVIAEKFPLKALWEKFSAND